MAELEHLSLKLKLEVLERPLLTTKTKLMLHSLLIIHQTTLLLLVFNALLPAGNAARTNCGKKFFQNRYHSSATREET
jgi:hypothetical protein